MFNYSVSFLLLCLLVNQFESAPINDEEEEVEIHDQRQNGTENYRVDMKDVLVVFSPLDTIFTLAGVAGEALLKPPGVETGSDDFAGGLGLLNLKSNDHPMKREQGHFHKRKW